MCAATAVTATACGSAGGGVVNAVRPPPPVNLSVYVNDTRVSVSPASVGAGPVVFTVTNQSRHAESLAISRATGGSGPLASTAPINPQGTTQVQVDCTPGEYTIATAPHGENDAQLTESAPIASASFHIGHERAGSGNQLLQP